jgi:hypothetical protein
MCSYADLVTGVFQWLGGCVDHSQSLFFVGSREVVISVVIQDP